MRLDRAFPDFVGFIIGPVTQSGLQFPSVTPVLDEIEFDQRPTHKLFPFGAGAAAPIMMLAERRASVGQHGEVVAGIGRNRSGPIAKPKRVQRCVV